MYIHVRGMKIVVSILHIYQIEENIANYAQALFSFSRSRSMDMAGLFSFYWHFPPTLIHLFAFLCLTFPFLMVSDESQHSI